MSQCLKTWHSECSRTSLWDAGRRVILGFHMTSLEFKLRNYRFFLSFFFHVILEYLKTFIKTNFRLKGFFVCDTGRLNFQAFA